MAETLETFLSISCCTESILVLLSLKLQEAQCLSVTEERYCAHFYMPLYKIIHNLLNVLVQTTNKIGLQGNTPSILFHCLSALADALSPMK
jgi:hypothetical protein